MLHGDSSEKLPKHPYFTRNPSPRPSTLTRLNKFRLGMPVTPESISNLLLDWRKLQGESPTMLTSKRVMLEELLKQKQFKAEPLHGRRASFHLTSIHARMLATPLDKASRTDALAELLVETKDTGEQLAKGPLRDAYALTECYLQYDLGKSEKSLQKAAGMSNPDARVFYLLRSTDQKYRD